MRLHVRIPLPADVSVAAAMLADPEYVHAKIRASGALEHQVTVSSDPSGAFTVTTRRSMPTSDIPANLRGFIGSSLDVRQVEAWEPERAGTRRGTVVVEIAGAPVRLTGTAVLSPTGAGSELAYEGEVKAAIPLFGGAVEGAAAQAIRSALAIEEDVARTWLSDDRPTPPSSPV